ncbi:MAG TPA: ParB/RepB/Spo0J family partition protein [Hellea balneolensis]|uniref:ParB/RepB/Spo0J family partition protein n=1 Tax=Hellea balneolensis TaxID=287478 RepID=A0A7C3GK11_9PROT|nr:ParB/RepB/Spo0J family partition protein [Hellea balneolensis]
MSTSKKPTQKPIKKSAKKPVKKQPKKQVLGRGLSALMADVALSHDETSVSVPKEATDKKPVLENRPTTSQSRNKNIDTLPIDRIERNPDQPRRAFDKTKLEELTNSIADKGVLQPILVRPLLEKPDDKGQIRYQIVAGERRWLAAQQAGLEHMPALIRELSDREVLEIGVVENVQRADLNPVEEAMAYQALKDQFGRRQEDIARAVGKSRPYIANMLRLLSLPELSRTYLREGRINAGHARAILAAPDPQALAELIVTRRMSVREAEFEVRRQNKTARPVTEKDRRRDADTRYIEQQLTDHLGLKISLKHKNPGGILSIKYRSLDDLEDLITKLKKA